VLVLFLSRTLIDGSPVFQYAGRLLVPLQPVLWLFVAGAVVWAARAWTSTAARGRVVAGFTVALTVLAVVQVVQARSVIGWPDGPGVVVARAPSATVAALGALAPDTVILSNDPARVYEQSGRTAVALPSEDWALSATANDGLRRDLAAARRALDHGAVVVYFDDAFFLLGQHLVPEQRLRTELDLRAVDRTSDGTIYSARRP
jgi:hypothetical protein